jgi:hypothetical protein
MAMPYVRVTAHFLTLAKKQQATGPLMIGLRLVANSSLSGETQAKQGPTTFISEGLVAAEIGDQTGTSDGIWPNAKLMTRTMPITRALRQTHRAPKSTRSLAQRRGGGLVRIDRHIQHRCDHADDKVIKAENKHRLADWGEPMNGTWRGAYSGRNTGEIVVEIDDVGDHFRGCVYAYDSNAALPSTFAAVNTADKSNKFKFKTPLVPLHPQTGEPTNWQVIASLYQGARGGGQSWQLEC